MEIWCEHGLTYGMCSICAERAAEHVELLALRKAISELKAHPFMQREITEVQRASPACLLGLRCAIYNMPGAEQQDTETTRWFPLQINKSDKTSKHQRTRVPWGIAAKAYSVYRERYGSNQSLEDLARRGGFGNDEMDLFYPSWREEADENERFRLQLTQGGVK